MSRGDRPNRRRIRTLAGIGAGAMATALAYPPFALPGLGAVMLAPIVALLDGTPAWRAFAVVWVYSVAMALATSTWMLHALVEEYGVSPLASWTFLVLVVGSLALVPATAGALWARLSPRLTAGAAPFAFAALWTGGEWLRAGPLGFPWLLVAQTWPRVPIAIQTAELGGVYAIGFTTMAFAAGLALALRRRRPWALAGPALLAAAALGFGAFRLARLPADAAAGTGARVGVVQASVPQDERFQPGSATRNVARHAEASQALARRTPLDLLVWSETAVDVDLDRAPMLRLGLERLAAELGVPIVTGAPRTAGGRHTNSVVLFAPGRGLVESYDKQQLVPFSEYDPPAFAWLAPLLGPVTEGEPYVAGTRPLVFRAGPVPFSAPVCFEITDPGLVSRFRAEGAGLIVNLSNDAWFGPVGYPEMHLDHAVLRAVENRSWVVRGANTGISAAIDPAGRVREEIAAFREGTFVAEVTAAGRLPFYARHGDGPVLGALFAVLLACLARPARASRARLSLPHSAAGRPRARG